MLPALFLIGCFTTAAASNGVISPGAPLYDTDGRSLQAHGAGLLEVNGTYYLIGENKTRTASNPRGNLFNSVACYSSKDLLSWEFQNNLLTNTNPHPDLAPDRVIERPKAIYNEESGKYVMWMHVDSSNYGDARSGVAVSDTPCGDYEYLGSLRPEGHIARDMTLFVDYDSTAYLVAEDRKEGTHFFQLSDNYTVVDSLAATIPYSFMSALEAPAVVKTNGVYYFFGSHLTGWSTNDNQYTTTKDLRGSWSKPATFAPTGSKTCNSQTTFVLRTAAGKFVYMGDRWNKNELDKSGYIWEPLDIDAEAEKATLSCRTTWKLSEVGL
ncbi:glycoside hydrolase family 43 [Fusarium denticulatum]|uniref:Glycoside hydrolase family 43 n=1 Tax=Fusarium denticulatum TaxID=48507 RepID=A0A8H5TGN5_9HYPO|nr:glycoside hydrolase family 43 [Fusarium denticulatum]